MTTNNRLMFAAALASAAFLASPPANASVVRSVDFDTKVAEAQSIVLGKVTKTESRWDPSHRWILTYSTVRVEESLKGNGGQEVTLVTPGGQVGNVGQSTVGIPSLEQGAEHVLFVKPSQVGQTILYFDQGTYDVKDQGNEKVITPVASEAVFVDSQRGMAVAAEEPRTLSQFRSEVRRAEKNALQRMELVRERQRQEAESASISSIILRNKLLISLALVGIALATWRFFKR